MLEKGELILKASIVIVFATGWLIAGIFFGLYQTHKAIAYELGHELEIAVAQVDMCKHIGGSPKKFDLSWTNEYGRVNRLEFYIDKNIDNVCIECHSYIGGGQ